MDDLEQAKSILETALLTAQEPLAVGELGRLFDDAIGADTIRRLLEDLRTGLAGERGGTGQRIERVALPGQA